MKDYDVVIVGAGPGGYHAAIRASQYDAKVALIENRVVGYVCSRYVLNEGHLMTLAVHVDFRRRGIATELMNSVLEELKGKGCTLLYLEVRVSNLDAIKFYEHFGFKIASFRKKYYSTPSEDGALMMRWL